MPLTTEEIKERNRAACREYYLEHKDYFKKKSAAYFASHKAEIRPRNNVATKKWKEKNRFDNMKATILERDHFACTSCGKTTDLVVHHIDGVSYHNSPKANNDPANLVTLCRSCHTKGHYREGGWRASRWVPGKPCPACGRT